MQAYQFLHKAHGLAEWQLESFEDGRHHARAFFFVAVESPAHFFVEALGSRLGDVVQDGRPAVPEVVGAFAEVV